MLLFYELFTSCTVVVERPLSSKRKRLPLEKDVCNVCNVLARKYRYEATDIQGKSQCCVSSMQTFHTHSCWHLYYQHVISLLGH